MHDRNLVIHSRIRLIREILAQSPARKLPPLASPISRPGSWPPFQTVVARGIAGLLDGGWRAGSGHSEPKDQRPESSDLSVTLERKPISTFSSVWLGRFCKRGNSLHVRTCVNYVVEWPFFIYQCGYGRFVLRKPPRLLVLLHLRSRFCSEASGGPVSADFKYDLCGKASPDWRHVVWSDLLFPVAWGNCPRQNCPPAWLMPCHWPYALLSCLTLLLRATLQVRSITAPQQGCFDMSSAQEETSPLDFTCVRVIGTVRTYKEAEPEATVTNTHTSPC